MNGTADNFSNRINASSALPVIAQRVCKVLEKIQFGFLTVQWPNGQLTSFGQHNGVDSQINAMLHLHNDRPLYQSMKSGDIGFAESFIAGDWTSPDLPALLRLLNANRLVFDQVIYGHWLGRLLYRLRHLLNRNTRKNSAKNIHAHYDLGNPFYQLWLDPSMNYSSAWFNGQINQNLTEAQNNKVRRALQEVKLEPHQHLMEIGCGWGALAQMAAQEFGAKVSGVTLSHEQLSFSTERMKQLGLDQQTDLRLQDYRDIKETGYDAVCSIEMVEAVGQEYWNTYFQTLYRLLKKGGRACVQSIVIEDGLFDRYIKSTDFIQQYIFPGGCLPSASEFKKRAAQAGLQLVNEMSFGKDYAETLRRWRAGFFSKIDQVKQLGFDEKFIRIWDFYLSYCEAGFEQASIDVTQYTFQKI